MSFGSHHSSTGATERSQEDTRLSGGSPWLGVHGTLVAIVINRYSAWVLNIVIIENTVVRKVVSG